MGGGTLMQSYRGRVGGPLAPLMLESLLHSLRRLPRRWY